MNRLFSPAVLYGTVVYGTARNGTVRYGTGNYGTERNKTVRNGTELYGTVPQGTLFYMRPGGLSSEHSKDPKFTGSFWKCAISLGYEEGIHQKQEWKSKKEIYDRYGESEAEEMIADGSIQVIRAQQKKNRYNRFYYSSSWECLSSVAPVHGFRCSPLLAT